MLIFANLLIIMKIGNLRCQLAIKELPPCYVNTIDVYVRGSFILVFSQCARTKLRRLFCIHLLLGKIAIRKCHVEYTIYNHALHWHILVLKRKVLIL